MASISPSFPNAGTGGRAATTTTLGASDTFTNLPGDVLMLRNPTGGALTLNIASDNPSAWPVPGSSALSTSAGKNVVVGAGAVRIVALDSVQPYLQGIPVLTGAAGLVATLFRK